MGNQNNNNNNNNNNNSNSNNNNNINNDDDNYNINNNSNNNNTLINTNFHFVFSNYSLMVSKKEEKIIYLEDGNIKLNQYLIYKNKLLGRGEYSNVYLCQNSTTNNYYAIKIQSNKKKYRE